LRVLKGNVKEFFAGIDLITEKPLLFCGGLAADNFALGKHISISMIRC